MPLLRSKLVISAGSQHRRGMPSRVRLLLVAGATAVLALVLGSGANASSIWGDSRRGGDQGGSVVGPSVCQSDNTTLGYNDTTALFYDALAMSSGVLAGDQKQGAGIEFVLCPGTIFDLGTDLVVSSSDTTQSQDMLGLIPLLDHTHYRCGSDGSPSNDCILRGGWYHVLFEDDLPVVNTTFLGLTFEGTLDVSVMGYGLPTNSAAFINCRWRNNGMGRYLVDNFWHLHLQGGIVEPGSRRMGPRERSRTRERLGLGNRGRGDRREDGNRGVRDSYMYDDAAQQWRLDDVHAYVEVLLRRRSDPAEMRPSRSLQRFNGDYPSMYLGFAGCAFEDNRVGVSLLNNAGGLLDVTKSHFGNNVAPSLIFNIQQARLALHGGTSFVNNSGLGIGPIFLDGTSSILIHEDTIGDSSVNAFGRSVRCEGIFMQPPPFTWNDCVSDPWGCAGTCCPWGQVDCAVPFLNDDVDSTNLVPTLAPTPPLPSEGGTKGTRETDAVCDARCVGRAVVLPLFGAFSFILTCSIFYRWIRGGDNLLGSELGEEETGEDNTYEEDDGGADNNVNAAAIDDSEAEEDSGQPVSSRDESPTTNRVDRLHRS